MKKPFKTSIHASVWGPRWDIAGIGPTLDAAAAIGYDHVVIPLRTFDCVDPPALAREFTRRGLIPLNTTGLPADCDIGDRSNAVRNRGIARLSTAVSMARDMGSSQINGVLYGPLVPAGFQPGSGRAGNRRATCRKCGRSPRGRSCEPLRDKSAEHGAPSSGFRSGGRSRQYRNSSGYISHEHRGTLARGCVA
jgi:hypothetical protein